MRRFMLLGVVLAVGVIAAPASAGIIDASGVLSWKTDGADYDYTITLTNTSGTGNDSIETFWYAWTPGQDYMAGPKPANIISPTGWTDTITGSGSSTDGYAIRWQTSTAALTPGESLGFQFTSSQTPAELSGDSTFHSHPPVGTSTIYSGQPFSGDTATFGVSSVPEPSSLVLGTFGLLVSSITIRMKLKRSA